MKYVLAIFLALVIDPGKIARVNSAKSEARKAYISGDYKKALEKYRYLADSMGVREDEVLLNLGHAYFQTNDTAQAIATYQSLIGSGKTDVRSKARQQLGILHHRQGKMEEALADFKQAVKADANNTDARYNYEMLKRKLDEKKKQDEKNNKKKPDPSPYARNLKARADALLKQFRFGEAAALMNEGLKRDATVEYYEDYMKRLDDVDKINRPK